MGEFHFLVLLVGSSPVFCPEASTREVKKITAAAISAATDEPRRDLRGIKLSFKAAELSLSVGSNEIVSKIGFRAISLLGYTFRSEIIALIFLVISFKLRYL